MTIGDLISSIRYAFSHTTVWFLILGIAAGIWITNSDFTDEAVMDHETRQYCVMVELHKQTQGDAGWPDYDNRYERDCK